MIIPKKKGKKKNRAGYLTDSRHIAEDHPHLHCSAHFTSESGLARSTLEPFGLNDTSFHGTGALPVTQPTVLKNNMTERQRINKTQMWVIAALPLTC